MKIAVTTLDSYRYWIETEYIYPEREKQAMDEIIAKIRGQKMAISLPALRGIAMHSIMEEPEKYLSEDGKTYACDGFTFDSASVSAFRLFIPDDAMREIWLPQYTIGDHYLVGRADLAHGNALGDYKCITKAFNGKKYDSYEDSIQWQASLLMADMDVFKYYIAHGKERRKDDLIILENFHVLPFYRTESTDERVKRLVHQFGKFAEPYLPVVEETETA